MKELIELLKANGGEIVSTSSLSAEDINQARASERMYVDADGFGFVWIPPLDRFPETEEEVENFEKWFPLEMEVPKHLQKLPEKLSSLQSKGKTSAEEFLRDKYKLVDFHDLTLNGKPWVELMEEYAQSHANKDGWVSCAERLPEMGEYVLCYGKGGRCFTCLYDHSQFLDSDYEEAELVTHWMPLPPKPQI